MECHRSGASLTKGTQITKKNEPLTTIFSRRRCVSRFISARINGLVDKRTTQGCFRNHRELRARRNGINNGSGPGRAGWGDTQTHTKTDKHEALTWLGINTQLQSQLQSAHIRRLQIRPGITSSLDLESRFRFGFR